MKRKKLIRIFIVSIVAIVLDLLYANKSYIGICPPNDPGNCHEFLSNFFAIPLLILASIIAIFTFVKLLFRQEVFSAWIKFAIPYTILSIIILVSLGGGGDSVFFGPSLDREIASIILSVLFFAISGFIIFIKSFTSGKKP